MPTNQHQDDTEPHSRRTPTSPSQRRRSSSPVPDRHHSHDRQSPGRWQGRSPSSHAGRVGVSLRSLAIVKRTVIVRICETTAIAIWIKTVPSSWFSNMLLFLLLFYCYCSVSLLCARPDVMNIH